MRDIHALHTENVNNEKWDPKTANTEVFLSKTLKTYFLELIDEKNQLAERNTILLSDNQKLQEDNKSLHHDCDTLRTKNNVYIVIIIILLVLFGVPALIPIICSIKQKKNFNRLHFLLSISLYSGTIRCPSSSYVFLDSALKSTTSHWSPWDQLRLLGALVPSLLNGG